MERRRTTPHIRNSPTALSNKNRQKKNRKGSVTFTVIGNSNSMNYASHQIYPYFFLLRIRKKIDRISAKISAAITAYQIPYGPNRIGSTRTQIT